MASISDLRPLSSGLNLTVKVLESKVVVDKPKTARSEGLKVAECIVGDRTGCIVFRAQNDQVEKAKPGNYLVLQNAKVDMFRGSMRLAVDGRVGQVEEATDQQFAPKTDNNMSLIEFEQISLDQPNAQNLQSS